MTTKQQRNEFVILYQEGKTILEIAQKHDLTWSTVYTILKNRRIPVHEEDEMCEKYLSGNSTVSISKYYGINNHLVSQVLESHGIPRTGVGRRRYQLNENYFDDIDTPNKAYIFGFLYADGYNSMSKGTISMSLQERDKQILEDIRKEVPSERPLEFIDYSNKHDFGYTYQDQYRLLMFSAHMCRTLESKGMPSNKSLTLEFPKWLDKELVSHFIRGYFDGDGCIHVTPDGAGIVHITSTNEFCNSLHTILEKYLGINAIVSEASNHNGITSVARINGNNQVKTFLDYIYKDADLFLERKHTAYLKKYY